MTYDFHTRELKRQLALHKDKIPSKTIIAAANELMNGINSQKTRLKKVEDINTLCNFGVLGLWTIREITTAFYSIMILNLKKQEKRNK